MLNQNLRIVKTARGYGVYTVTYDARGDVVSVSDESVMIYHSDSECGLTDYLETIQLAFEKPTLDWVNTDKRNG